MMIQVSLTSCFTSSFSLFISNACSFVWVSLSATELVSFLFFNLMFSALKSSTKKWRPISDVDIAVTRLFNWLTRSVCLWSSTRSLFQKNIISPYGPSCQGKANLYKKRNLHQNDDNYRRQRTTTWKDILLIVDNFRRFVDKIPTKDNNIFIYILQPWSEKHKSQLRILLDLNKQRNIAMNHVNQELVRKTLN